MIYPDTDAAPGNVVPPHEITFPHYVAELAVDMRRRGWRGRPLLAEQLSRTRYKAWTGSHRVAAAVLAEIASIPIVLVDTSALKFIGMKPRPEAVFCGGTIEMGKPPAAGSRVEALMGPLPGARPVRSETYLCAIGGDQEEWRDALREAKDDRAAQLLSYEIRLNRRQWKRDQRMLDRVRFER
jgi:hypothetical protein